MVSTDFTHLAEWHSLRGTLSSVGVRFGAGHSGLGSSGHRSYWGAKVGVVSAEGPLHEYSPSVEPTPLCRPWEGLGNAWRAVRGEVPASRYPQPYTPRPLGTYPSEYLPPRVSTPTVSQLDT